MLTLATREANQALPSTWFEAATDRGEMQWHAWRGAHGSGLLYSSRGLPIQAVMGKGLRCLQFSWR